MSVFLQLSSSVHWRRVENEIVILDLNSSKYFTLNGSATFLWDRVAEGVTDVDLIQLLIARYNISGANAREDLAAFVVMLRECGLLEQ